MTLPVVIAQLLQDAPVDTSGWSGGGSSAVLVVLFILLIGCSEFVHLVVTCSKVFMTNSFDQTFESKGMEKTTEKIILTTWKEPEGSICQIIFTVLKKRDYTVHIDFTGTGIMVHSDSYLSIVYKTCSFFIF